MKKSIEELINYFRKMGNDENAGREQKSELMENGYSAEDIETARRLADGEYGKARQQLEYRISFSRVFSESEKLKLSVEAQGYLLGLISRKLISEPQLGLIIESIGIELNTPASLQDIKLEVNRYVSGIEDGSGEMPVNGARKIN